MDPHKKMQYSDRERDNDLFSTKAYNMYRIPTVIEIGKMNFEKVTEGTQDTLFFGQV